MTDRSVAQPEGPISSSGGETIGHVSVSMLAAAPDMYEALKGLLADIESGLLVRDIARDADTGWARHMLNFVQRLQRAQAAIAKAEGR